jgi:hypothetical protein
MNILAIRAQVYDRVTNDLPQPMIGNLATAIGFKNSYAALV